MLNKIDELINDVESFCKYTPDMKDMKIGYFLTLCSYNNDISKNDVIDGVKRLLYK